MTGVAPTILVVDDEPDVARAVSLTISLQEPSWTVVTVGSGNAALAWLAANDADAVLLDIQMPEMDGYEVMGQIRLYSDVPIIILTVRDDELDIVRGLQSGADDYIVKPFGRLELVARLRSTLRRAGGRAGPWEPPITVGRLRIDREQRRVHLNGQPIPLTSTEFRLLEVLARSRGRVVPTEALLVRVWGDEAVDDTDYVKTYVHRLRAKLEDDPANPRYLLTYRGVGYWMPRQPEDEARAG